MSPDPSSYGAAATAAPGALGKSGMSGRAGAAPFHGKAAAHPAASSPSKAGIRAPTNTSAPVSAKRAIYDDWFRAADSDGDGRVTGADAVAFFARSGLERAALARVWELSNSARAGYLDKPSFFRAMDLISLAQASGGLVPRDAGAALGGNGGGNDGGGNGNGSTIGAGGGGQRLSTDEMVSADSGTYDSYVGGGLGPTLAAPRMAGLCTDLLPDAGANASAAAAAAAAADAAAAAAPATSKQGAPGSSGNLFKKAGLAFGRPRPAPIPARVCTSVVDGLKAVYFGKVRPLEEAFRLDAFFQPLLQEADFDAKPSVLLLGQYSTGKTTFVRHLLGRAYPGAHVGPEPTTDRFVVVRGGLEERRTPGHTLAVQPDQPYQALNHFGAAFLSRFEGTTCPAPLLDSVTLVDTPGVLSGEKQRVERQYDFVGAVEWFASRADMVLLLFDPFKLDVSDELKACVHALRGHEEKVRVVLNKADMVDQQELMRVYGALMWSLSKVFRSPETCKVYIGGCCVLLGWLVGRGKGGRRGRSRFSKEERGGRRCKKQKHVRCNREKKRVSARPSATKNTRPFPPCPNKPTQKPKQNKTGSFNAGNPISEARNPHGKPLFEAEHAELLGDLLDIPARACDRRVNEFVKRVRALRVHMLLLGALRKRLPAVFGKERAQRRLLDEGLPAVFQEVQREARLPAGDFPELARFRAALAGHDLSKFPALTPAMMRQVEGVLGADIPALVRAFENPF